MKIAISASLLVLGGAFPAAPKLQSLSVSSVSDGPASLLSSTKPKASFWDTPKCHDKKVVDSSDNKFLECPKECPIWADDFGDGTDCNFECVEATPKACMAVNKNEPVPDVEMGICRGCIIDGCDVCTTEGEDTCAKCMSGYKLVNGLCKNLNKPYWYALFAFLGCMFLFMMAFMADLFSRPEVNKVGLTQALTARSRAKNRMPKKAGESGRELWPLSTNLLRQKVAGVGITLQFNFFAVTIVWALAVGIGWMLLALNVDDALLILGTRRGKTARQNCILVAWGYETQHRLMWTKVDFVAVVYVATFILCMVHGIRQLRIFQKSDFENTTHKDFAARIRNLPLLEGTVPVEEELKKRVEEATGKKVVGVSVCWDFQEHEDDLMELIESQAVEADMALFPIAAPEVEPEEPESFFAKMERSMLLDGESGKVVAKGEMTAEEHAEAARQAQAADADDDVDMADVREVDVVGILREIKTCPDAYAIFETEADRDEAVDLMKQRGGFEYRGNTLTMNASRVEPHTVNWPNCANTDLMVKAKRIAMGCGFVVAGLTFWVVVFYLPYAWFSLTFNYSYGQEPGFVAGMTFSMVVVAGNLLMYEVCRHVADSARFIYVDDCEVCYMLLFCFSCVFNVALDLITTYYVAYRINVGLHMKTYSGHLLANLQSFTEKFESYAMQRLLANNLWAYAFPATFLIPFCIEPVATIYAPYKIMSKIVATQPQIKGYMAERLLQSPQLDLSRYADVLLNIIIAVLIFFFPGGFNIQMFVALAGSHCYVYAFDHYRVLRSMKKCDFSDRMVDWWAQWILSVPMGLILACFVFKSNCEPGYYCLKGEKTVAACAAAFFFHVILHTICLLYIVPRFGMTGGSDGDESYKSCSQRLCQSWFSSNPIFCLRSQYFYKHDPPCTFCIAGKEHLLQVNEAIGLYFLDDPAKEEDYDAPPVDTEALKAKLGEHKDFMSSSLTNLTGKVSGLIKRPGAEAAETEEQAPAAEEQK